MKDTPSLNVTYNNVLNKNAFRNNNQFYYTKIKMIVLNELKHQLI